MPIKQPGINRASLRRAGAGFASGSISQLTSTGGTVTITNPFGPVTNLEVAGGGGTVTSVGSADGSVTVANPTTTPDLSIAPALGKVEATWTVGICRVYAVDTVNGNDTNKGYADPATNSAANYAVACAAAGAVALKTFAGLRAIFPKLGAGRQAEVVIANGGVNTLATYANSIDQFLSGAVGYDQLTVRTTGTNTTAGCVAFDGSVADATYLGGVTGTGLNAAGYTPTGTPTTTVIQCTKVGGGAPGFAAEPAIPLGLRIRFDNSPGTTTQLALRNVERWVSAVPGTDTVSVALALPAVPNATDTFYLETPGIAQGTCNLGENAMDPANSLQIVGIQTTGTANLRDGRFIFAFARFNAISAFAFRNLTLQQTYVHTVLGTLTVGGTRNETTLNCQQGVSFTFFYNLNVGTFTVNFNLAVSCQTQSVFATGMAFQNQFQSTSSAALLTALRIIGPGGSSGLNLSSGFLDIGALAFTNMGAKPAIKVVGQFVLRFDATIGTASGSSGNTDVGLDLSQAVACSILITVGNLPTVTGTAGDVRLAGGTIITWAQAAAGVVDINGNIIQSVTAAAATIANRMPMKRVPFSGSIIGAAGATLSYLADSGPLAANQTTALRRATSSVLARSLRVTSVSNTSVNAVTVTLYKNGAATALTVSIPAGSAANTKFVDQAHQAYFADGDDMDVRLDDAGDIGGIVTVSGFVEFA